MFSQTSITSVNKVDLHGQQSILVNGAITADLRPTIDFRYHTHSMDLSSVLGTPIPVSNVVIYKPGIEGYP